MLIIKCCSGEMSSYQRWKHAYSVGDITFIEDISTKYFCDPRHFLLVHLLNSWLLSVHSSSSIMVLKIAKRLFEGRGEMIKCVLYSSMFWLFIEIYWSVLEATLNITEVCSVWLCRNIRKVLFDLFLQYFSTNSNKDSSSEAHSKSSKTSTP